MSPWLSAQRGLPEMMSVWIGVCRGTEQTCSRKEENDEQEVVGGARMSLIEDKEHEEEEEEGGGGRERKGSGERPPRF